MEIITRKFARNAGLKRYFTGRACPHGHVCERDTKRKFCIQCNRDRVKRWAAANPDKVAANNKRNAAARNEASKRSKLKNPEKYRALRRAYRDKNRDHCNRSSEAARAKKPEKYRALRSAWEKNNRDKIRVWVRRNQGRRRGASGKFSASDIDRIFREQRRRCAYFAICGTKFQEGDQYHVDHILAISRGGSNDPNNLQILCGRCNRRKSAKDAIEFMRSNGLLL